MEIKSDHSFWWLSYAFATAYWFKVTKSVFALKLLQWFSNGSRVIEIEKVCWTKLWKCVNSEDDEKWKSRPKMLAKQFVFIYEQIFDREEIL